MATIRNITPDARSVFSPDSSPAQPDDEVTISDARFAGLAWPKSTWELVTPPEGMSDESTDDAYVFTEKPESPAKKPGGKP